MKLFVDDIRTPPDDSWNICRSALSAVRALDMFMLDVTHIALDHDISHQVYMGAMSRPYPCDETFEVVARHIASLKKWWDAYRDSDSRVWEPIVSIHTSNPAGAQAMKAILEEVGIVPTIQLARGANRLETIL